VNFAVIVTTHDAETAWNAFRFAVKALDSGHAVRAFLLGPDVECEEIRHDRYDVPGPMRTFAQRGGELLACGTCLRARQMDGSDLCPISTMQDLVELTAWADRVLTF
jgi:sulfur relay (sulfurtransferase) complex TusBCD TusD component (DsrE family)